LKLSLKIPPLAQAAIAVFLIWLVDRHAPLYHIDFNYQNLVARVLIGTGLIIALSGVLTFRKLKTTVDPRIPEKAKKLVFTGIYKYTRNPMYLGLLLAITGVAVYSGAFSSLFVVFLFAAFINKYQIIPEEVALQEKFGDSYTHYTRNVRRWL